MSRNRKIKVQPRRRDQPDVPKLARALIALAQAEAERAAQAEHQVTDAGADTKEPVS